MRSALPAMVILAALSIASSARAEDQAGGESLLEAKGCLTCHAIDKRKMGPSFKSIAAKYAGKGDAEGTLLAKLRDAKGHPKVAASEAELRSMIAYILSLPK